MIDRGEYFNFTSDLTTLGVDDYPKFVYHDCVVFEAIAPLGVGMVIGWLYFDMTGRSLVVFCD